MRKFLKKGIVMVTTVAIAVSGLNVYVGSTTSVKADDEYKLLWSDEFNGSSLNRNNWNVEVNGNGNGNNELQYYRDNEENISVSDGTLKIIAKKQTYRNKRYTSGRITTQGLAQFKYGKIEAKIKMPCFSGIWPAFWMLGANYKKVGWPKCGEIDIMEAINSEQFTHSTLHWFYDQGNSQADHGKDSKIVLPYNFDRSQWHTYGMEWDSNYINFYVDGKIFMKQDISEDHMSEFREEQFIILNLAVGGDWPGFNIDDSKMPATMEVDYVRVYQKDSDNGSHSGTTFDVKEEETTTNTNNNNNNNNTNSNSQNNAAVNAKRPSKAKIARVVRSKNNRKAKVTIKKIKKVKGYQIKYSTSAGFSKKTTKYVFTKKTTKTITKLKANKKYYFKVRAYVTVNNRKCYGKWSTKKVAEKH